MLALLSASTAVASATSLRVAPTLIDLSGADSASVLNLHNEAKGPVNVQVRVFRWSQSGGVETLEPTTNVVASPPSMKLAPGQDYVVRVVRVSKTPVQGEESYRVLVDEVPLKSERRAGMVNLVVRQSIPVFYHSNDASGPEVTWSVAPGKGGMMLTATNNGSSRMKISDLSLNQGGKAVVVRKGLFGYVLGGATMSWPIGGKAASGLVLKANSDAGPISAKVH